MRLSTGMPLIRSNAVCPGDIVPGVQATPAGAQTQTLVVAPPPPPSPPAPPAPPPVPPIKAGLSSQGKGKKKKLFVTVTLSDGTTRTIRAPFQKPVYTAIAVSLLDSNGDGRSDAAMVKARKGRKSVSRIVALLDELEDLTSAADECSSPLLWQARAAIERTREILVSPAPDGGLDPQPDIDCTLLERMYRDLNPYS